MVTPPRSPALDGQMAGVSFMILTGTVLSFRVVCSAFVSLCLLALQLVAHHVGVPYRVLRAFEPFLGTPFVLVIQALKSFPKATVTSSTLASSVTPTTIHPA